jgi:hypothetical protein
LKSEVKKLLTLLAEKYENESFLADDPSQFMHKVKGVRNREAMAFIASLMNNSGYSPMAVHDVERLEAGVYKLTVRTSDTTAYRNIMQSYRDSFVSYECFFIATFGDDGVLNTLESELVISGNKYDYTVKSKLEINKE